MEEEGAVRKEVDALTENWPVERDEHRQYVNEIKYEYRAVPLLVYRNEQFIDPVNVKNVVQRALVELHFELRHFCIQKKSQDSFNGSIEQVIVLQPGESHPAIPYELSYKHSARARNPYACSETERRWCRTFNPNLYSMGS